MFQKIEQKKKQKKKNNENNARIAKLMLRIIFFNFLDVPNFIIATLQEAGEKRK